MSVYLQQLSRDKWEDAPSSRKPFWLPLLAMLVLSASFMQFLDPEPIDGIVEVSELRQDSVSSKIKFAMHIVAYTIMGFIFIKHSKGRIPKSSDLKLYVTYCILVILSVFVYSFRTNDASTVMFARAFDLILLVFVILVFLRMEIEDSFFITFVAISAPIFIVFLTYLLSPEQAFLHFSSSKTGDIIYRFGGKVVHPNTLGGVAAISLIMIFGAKIKTFSKLLLSPVFFLGLIFSQSRMAFLAFGLSLLASLILFRGRSVTKLIVGCVLTLVAMAVIVAYQSGAGDFIPGRDMLTNVNTMGGRALLWEIALKEFFNGNAIDFLFGIEPFFSNKQFIVTDTWKTSNLHNSYLHVLIGCGIFTAIIYTWMLIRLLRVKASRKGLTFSLRAIAIYILINGLTEETAATKMGYFTILLPLLMAQCYQIKSIGNTQSKTPHNNLS